MTDNNNFHIPQHVIKQEPSAAPGSSSSQHQFQVDPNHPVNVIIEYQQVVETQPSIEQQKQSVIEALCSWLTRIGSSGSGCDWTISSTRTTVPAIRATRTTRRTLAGRWFGAGAAAGQESIEEQEQSIIEALNQQQQRKQSIHEPASNQQQPQQHNPPLYGKLLLARSTPEMKSRRVDAAKDASENVIYRINIPTSRCDLLCQLGLVQGLQVKEFPEFKKVASAKGPPQKLIVTEATKQIRPFAGPFTHDAKAPKDIKFVLLNQVAGVITRHTKANVYIGIDDSAEALAKMLNRVFPTTRNASNQLEVLNPPTRHDMLHVCDIEDVGAYGYNRIPKTLPATMHIARQCPLNKLTRLHIEKIPAVHIANPKTLEFQVVRTSLIPGLIKTLAANRKIPLPLNLFEVSDVVMADSKAEVGAKNERRVCAVKLLDRFFCYWDALGQAGLLPARPHVKVISASRPPRKKIPNGDKITRPVCCHSKPCIRSVPYHRELVPLPPQYFLRIVSDRWILLPISALHEPRFEELYPDRFPSARRRLRNLQFCACYSRIRVVHLVSRNALAEQIFMDWHQKFGQNSGCKVVKLTEETGTNIKLIA
ncbi:phenylalanyl-tRNA synthetase beta chain [Culex quinquefasciatus]|uniref:phenylalanine--tRNA ligase n=1 Tax=Culex quinquefasciatus TaxID=7176 RepID=B0X9I4_CULQU|nr:phenylalanyl-tRNA synthetase beta chain [Culex quinquefasciatus]|eukprot:XP_001866306.1 phenylalanyl-tRNA synthetase beta chain [Culex quinquefasciatus]